LKTIIGISEELETTKAILAQTENFLNQAKADNQQFSAEKEAELMKTREGLQATIALLEGENTQINQEMTILKGRMDYYLGDVKNTDDSLQLLTFYEKQIKLVRTKIKRFNRDVRQVRIAAQREYDRLKSELGNNGYFVKEGQVIQVDMEKYNAVGSNQIPVEAPAPNFKVDVTFVE